MSARHHANYMGLEGGRIMTMMALPPADYPLQYLVQGQQYSYVSLRTWYILWYQGRFNDNLIREVFCYFGNKHMANLAKNTSNPSIDTHVKIAKQLLFSPSNAL